MKIIIFAVLIIAIVCQSCLDNTHCKPPTVCQPESQTCYVNGTEICNENNKCYSQCPEGTRNDPKLSFDLGYGVCVKFGTYGSSPRCALGTNNKCVPCYKCSGFDKERPCIPCLIGTGGNTLLPCIPTWKGKICIPPTVEVLGKNNVVIKHTCPLIDDNCCPDLKCRNKPSGGGSEPTGACCHSGVGNCVITTFLNCIGSFNGKYFGDSTSCPPSNEVCLISSSGTCTLPGGICSAFQSQSICEANGGVFTPGGGFCPLI